MKRFSALLLIFALLLSVAPFSLFAGDTPQEDLGNNDEPVAEIIASGTCGDAVTWTIDDAGTLTLSGSGEMDNYVEGQGLPWSSYLYSVKSVVISDGITSIGDCAFYNCRYLSSVTIPDSVTRIGNYSFVSCYSLESFYISKYVTSVGTAPFNICRNLKHISVDPENEKYTSENGVLYNKAMTYLFTYPAGKTDKSFVIPDSVETVGFRSFYVANNLSSVVIPESVTKIESFAFEYCNSLKTVTIETNLSYIGNLVFAYTPITDIALPHGLKEIGQGAFNSSSLETIHYAGTQEDWDKIIIRTNNAFLSTVTKHFLEDQSAAPTCLSSGIADRWYCPECDRVVFAGTVIPATGEHSLIHHEGQAATCGSAGWEPYDTCEHCDYTTYAEIPATNEHSLIHHEGQAATCGSAGWEPYDTCEHCDYTTYAEIPATNEHTCEVLTPYPAECEKEGREGEGLICTVCGEIVIPQTVIAPLGHDLVHHEGQAATCGSAGWEPYDTCTRCDYTTYAEIPAIENHNYEIIPPYPATCTEEGRAGNGLWCSICHEVFKEQEIILPLGHDLIHHDGCAATCVSSGYEPYDTCSRCDYTTYKETGPTGIHTAKEDEAVAATCSHTGLTVGFSCQYCDYVFIAQQETEKLPHTQGQAVFTSPRNLENGVKTAYCSVCGEVISETPIASEITDISKDGGNITLTLKGSAATRIFLCGYDRNGRLVFVRAAVLNDKKAVFSTDESLDGLSLKVLFSDGDALPKYVTHILSFD